RFGANHLDYAVALNAQQTGHRVSGTGQVPRGGGLFEQVLAIRDRALGANHPAVGETLNNLALVSAAQGKYTEAEGDRAFSRDIFWAPRHFNQLTLNI